PRLITFTPAGMRTEVASPTAVIRLLVTITMALLIAGEPVPSIRRAARSATTPLPSGDSGRIPIGDGFCGSTEMHRQLNKIRAVNISLKFLTAGPFIFLRHLLILRAQAGSLRYNSRRILVEI